MGTVKYLLTHAAGVEGAGREHRHLHSIATLLGYDLVLLILADLDADVLALAASVCIQISINVCLKMGRTIPINKQRSAIQNKIK